MFFTLVLLIYRLSQCWRMIKVKLCQILFQGSAITRMFKNVLTRETFRTSLKASFFRTLTSLNLKMIKFFKVFNSTILFSQRYLERHQYGVVTTPDFWAAMQEVGILIIDCLKLPKKQTPFKYLVYGNICEDIENNNFLL